MEETYLTKRRIYKEGLSEEFFQEALKNVREPLFGSAPMYGTSQVIGGSSQSILADLEAPATIYSFGVLYGRGQLTLKDRAPVVLVAMMVLGRMDTARIWINTCLNLGWSEEEIREFMIWTHFFAGFPTMRATAREAADVFEKRKKDPSLKMA